LAKPINASKMGLSNKLILFNMIRYSPGTTRKELAEKTGLNPSTITNIINFLKEKDLVVEIGKKKNENPGRNSIRLYPKRDRKRVFLAKLGVEKTYTGLGYLDNSCDIINEYETPGKIDQFIELVVADYIASHKPGESFGMVLSVPGIVDNNNGTIINLPHLKWKEIDFSKRIRSDINKDIRIWIENEAKLSLRTEIYINDDISGLKNGVLLYISQGVGGALLINRQLFAGNSFTAGEIGHMSIDVNGPRCKCGNRGCLECYISVEEVVKEYERLGGGMTSRLYIEKFRELLRKNDNGEPRAREIMEEYYDYLELGLVNIVNLINPEFIVMGGMGSIIPLHMLKLIERKLKSRVISPAAGQLRLVPSKIDMVKSAMVGETILAMDYYCREMVL